MKIIAVLLLCFPLYAQNPDAAKFSPRAIVLIDATPGVESVMPMVFTENGQTRIEYIPASQIKDSIDKRGGKPIRLGDVLALLGQQNQQIAQLQAENAKLWQAVTNGAPKTQTVVVQTPTGPSPEELAERQREADMANANARRQQIIQAWGLMLQNQNQTQTINLNYRNCSRYPALCVGR